MIDTFDFLGGILIGTFVGSLVTLIYHMREFRQEARQNYVRLSLAQSEVISLERKLEIHRLNSVADFAHPQQNPSESGSEARIPIWIGDCDSPIADTTSSGPCAKPEKPGSDTRKSKVLETRGI